jgi:O-antigen/teichoic acid export membrane protein
MSLAEKVAKGVAWSGTTQALRYALNLLITVALARLLAPRDFGLVGTASIFVGFAGSLQGMGLIASLYQRKDLSQDILSSVFWMNLGFSAVLLLLLLTVAPLIAAFFGEPAIQYLLYLSGLTIPISALWNIHFVLLLRDLDFRRMGMLAVWSELISGLAAIMLALMGFGFWSLAGKELTASVASVCIMWVYLRNWRPSMHFRLKDLNGLWQYGLNRSGGLVVEYWQGQIDLFFVGRLLGAEALGFYMVAFNLVKIPVTRLFPLFNQVLFPALVLIRDDLSRVRKVHLRMMRYVILAGVPSLLSLAFLAVEVLGALYGKKWLPSAPALAILAVWGVVYLMTVQLHILLLALGRADSVLRLTLLSAGIMVPAIYIGAQFGIVGVAFAWFTPSLLILECYRRTAHSILDISRRDMYCHLGRAICIATGIALSLGLFHLGVTRVWPSAPAVLTLVMCGVFGVLVGLLIYFQFENRDEINRTRVYLSGMLRQRSLQAD